MIPALWVSRLYHSQRELRELVRRYHPSSKSAIEVPAGSGEELAVSTRELQPLLPVTAPAAQDCCNKICEEITKRSPDSPVLRYDAALANQDLVELQKLLQEAWFGVPESTSCWLIPGFTVLVDLLDDPPEVG